MDANGLPVINRLEDVAQIGWFNVNQLLSHQPTAQQQGQFMSMLSHSGLGNQGQRIGQLLIQSYENTVNFNNQAFLAMLPQNGIPVNNTTSVAYTIGLGESIPVGRMAVEAQKTAAGAQQQLQNDVDAIDQYNSSLSQINDRVIPVLNDIAGQDLGSDTVGWQVWLNNLVGFNLLQASAPPTITEDVPLAYQPQAIPLDTFSAPISVQRMSCFGAGTMVRTLTGSQPIESLKLGDQVLTQSVKTGALAYKPILAVHHNPPSKTFEIKLRQ